MMSDEAIGAAQRLRHPIRVVARRTGISRHVLRAWERRYGVVAPGRTGGGQRVYSDADIERLKLLRQLVEAGWPISRAAELSEAELVQLAAEAVPARDGGSPGSAVAQAGGASGDGAAYVDSCLEAAARADYEVVRRVLVRAVVSLRPGDLLEQVIGPLLTEVGERWHRGELRAAQEHAVSVAVRSVLAFLLSAYEAELEAPLLVATTLEGDLHEFGALLASLVAAEAGWRVLYLGPSLPVDEIVDAAVAGGAAAVALSVVDGIGEAELVRELGRLRAGLPAAVRVLVGGRMAAAHRAAVARLEGVEPADLELLRRTLPRFTGGEVLA